MTPEEYSFFLAYGVVDDAELQMQELNEELYLVPKVQALETYPVLSANVA